MSPRSYSEQWAERAAEIKPTHIRESKTVLDSGFRAMDSGLHVPDSLSAELGFRILSFIYLPY